MSWMLASVVMLAQATPAIRVDQVGYLEVGPKRAAVVVDPPATAFAVRRVDGGAVAFEGDLGSPRLDPDTGDRVQLADFTPLAAPGRYVVEVPGLGQSWPFEIGAGVYDRALYLAMRSFYGQRCGTDVDLGPEFPGYAYAACHRSGAWHASSGRTGSRESTRGWHDAGDYGRYVVNSGITTGTLLLAFELFRDRLEELDLDLPESGGRLPDFLAELRWNLDWMQTLQDDDGGVWHKQTSANFPGFVLPQADDSVSLVIGTGAPDWKGSCATGDFAAVAAIAARVFEPWDADYSRRQLEAARRAWDWLESHPDATYSNPSDVFTGGYGDGDCGDERLWAAAELWRSGGHEGAHAYFLERYPARLGALASPPGWPQVAPLGLWSYALAPGANAEDAQRIREAAVAAADAIVVRSEAHPYRISMLTNDFVWGSNGVAANYGVQLLVANEIRADARYVETALENLHYLLGRNAFSLSWVTQLGANPFRNPHHRPSGSDANPEPWPGLLAGGPNRFRQDPAMERLPPGLPPGRSYVDHQDSYASNENAINWNAPLVFLLAGVSR
jgi:endoglucanase